MADVMHVQADIARKISEFSASKIRSRRAKESDSVSCGDRDGRHRQPRDNIILIIELRKAIPLPSRDANI